MSNTTLEDDLNILQREPTLITGIVVAVIGLLGSLGLQIDDSTTAAISTLLLSILTLAGALILRRKVTPTVKAEVQKTAAVRTAVAQTQASQESNEDRAAEEPVHVPEPSSSAIAGAVVAPNTTEGTLAYDADAVVLPDNSVTEAPVQDSGVVVSNVEEVNSLESALKLLDEANAKRDEALQKANEQLKAVREEASVASSAYASRIEAAVQQLSKDSVK